MKKIIAFILSLAMVLTLLAGCGRRPSPAPETSAEALQQVSLPAAEPAATEGENPVSPAIREFTDSTGRTVKIPYEVRTIAVSGPLSQIYVLPLAGDMLVGVSRRFAEDAKDYLPAEIYDKTEIGQLYGGKGELDLEALLAAAPDVVIDVGEAKKTIQEDMDSLTAQTGIPFVHIDAAVTTAPQAYRMLGKLLDRQEKAEELAVYCQEILDMTQEMMTKVDAEGKRKTILYCLGDTGTNVIAEGSFHAETVNTMSQNLAVLEDVVSKGTGNEVDMEQILSWNPEVIVFGPNSIYDTVGDNPAWASLQAIAGNNYFEEPSGPHGWLSSPPSVQRYLGLLWLGKLLYPEYAEYDLQEKITEYYQLFYSCELTNEMYLDLIKNSLPSN